MIQISVRHLSSIRTSGVASAGLFSSTTPLYFIKWIRSRFSPENQRAAEELLQQYAAGSGSGEMAHAISSSNFNDAFNRKFNVPESMQVSNNNSNNSSTDNNSKWNVFGATRGSKKGKKVSLELQNNTSNTSPQDEVDKLIADLDEHKELVGSRRVPITHVIEQQRMERLNEKKAEEAWKREQIDKTTKEREVDERKMFWKKIQYRSLYSTRAQSLSLEKDSSSSTTTNYNNNGDYGRNKTNENDIFDEFNMPRHPEDTRRERADWEFIPTPEHKSLVLLLYRNLLKGLINFKSVRRRSLIAYARIIFRRRAMATEKLLIDECIEECRRAIYVIQKHHDMLITHDYEYDNMAIPKDTGQDVKTYMEEVYDPEMSRAQFQNFSDVQPGKEHLHQQSLSPTSGASHWHGSSKQNDAFNIEIKDEDKAFRPPPPPSITQSIQKH